MATTAFPVFNNMPHPFEKPPALPVAGMKHRVPLSARNAPSTARDRKSMGGAYLAPTPRRTMSARPSSAVPGKRPSSDPLIAYGYQTLSPIAQGAFSQVTRARHLSTKIEVAVKTFNKAKINKEEHLAKAMKNELEVLKLLQPSSHANIANILECVETERSILCVLEYCGGGSLQRHLQGLPGFGSSHHSTGAGSEMSRSIGLQVACALAHMHGQGLAHRDVKPENILFTDESKRLIKLCDFGFSIACGNRRVRTVCGSPQYMAPELSRREPYHGWACDVWAYAALCFEMLEGRPCFRGSSMEQLNIRIMRASHEAFTPATPSAARQLIKSLLVIDPNQRLQSSQIVEHHWFTGQAAAPAPSMTADVIEQMYGRVMEDQE